MNRAGTQPPVRSRGRPSLAVLWFWLVATLVLVAATAFTLWDARGRQVAIVERHLAALSVVLGEQTTRSFQSVDLILRGAAERFSRELQGPSRLDDESVNAILGVRISGVPQLRSLFVVGTDGKVRYSAMRSPIGMVVGDRDYVAVHRDRAHPGTYIGKPVRNRVDGEWSIFVSRRYDDPHGNYAGVVVASIPLGYFDALYQSIKPDHSSAISLFLRDGTLLYGEPHVESELGKSFADHEVFRALESNAGGSLIRTSGPAARVVAAGVVHDFPLVTAISVSEHSALHAWRNQAMRIVAVMAGMAALLGAAAYAFARGLRREEGLAETLREREARLQGIISSAMDAIVTTDESGRIVLFNPAAERMLGCTAENALGSPLDRFIPQRFRSAHHTHVARFNASGEMARPKESRSEIVALRADGEEIIVDASISQVSASGGKLYTAVLRDIALRLQREEELRSTNRRLRELSASLESVREEERTRIARELHDDLGQQLTGLRMNLSWIGSRLREENPDMSEKVGGLQKQIDMTIASVRRITAELRPLMLDDLGLFAAAGWLAGDIHRKTGLEVECHLDEVEPELDVDTASALFRILQESLTNVVRHAQASHVHIWLEVIGECVALRVEDDGKGMVAADQGKPHSFGLLGIRERVYLLGGELHTNSEAGQGTTIEVVVPLVRPKKDAQRV